MALSFVTFAGVSPGNEKTARNTYSKACVHTAVPVPIGLEIRIAYISRAHFTKHIQCSALLLVAAAPFECACVCSAATPKALHATAHLQCNPALSLSYVTIYNIKYAYYFYSPYVATLAPVRRRETIASFTAAIPPGTR